VCRAFVQFCRSQALYGGETIAIDGSKFGADNNRGKVTRRQELKQQVQRLDTQISSWLDELADNDDDDEPPSGGDTQAALEALKAERPEARLMRHGQVGYNVQSAVEGKHCLIVDVDVVQNANDQEQLYRMARRTQRQ
jgi:hypothetical protein